MGPTSLNKRPYSSNTESISSNTSTTTNQTSSPKSFLQNYFSEVSVTHTKTHLTLPQGVQHEKYSALWWWDKFIICVVFAITGSATMFIVRPILQDVLQVQGTLMDGPWAYRIAYFLVMMPAYSATLVAVGTVFGRYAYFSKFAVKMWSRFLPSRLRAQKQQ
jgi:hypothetical protein